MLKWPALCDLTGRAPIPVGAKANVTSVAGDSPGAGIRGVTGVLEDAPPSAAAIALGIGAACMYTWTCAHLALSGLWWYGNVIWSLALL